jgi:predicted DNA-binding helix-hairpin-helix protein
MKVKIPGMAVEVERFNVSPHDFDKRLRVFAGPRVLRNDKLRFETKLNRYYGFSKSAIRHKRGDVLTEITALWVEWLMEEIDDES